MKEMNQRYIARIVVEAATPLALGSGEKSLITDRLIARDISGLPFIPGTSIAGVLRHSFILESEMDKEVANEWEKIFGFQKHNKTNEGQGSRLIVSSGYFLGKDHQVFEGLSLPDWNDPFYAAYRHLPVRDHVSIGHTGAAKKGAKFDEEVVIKGTRFVFELELLGNSADSQRWIELLKTLRRSDFRLGGGTRKGFGELIIISVQQRCFDLSKTEDFKDYLKKSSSLKDQFDGEPFEEVAIVKEVINYRLKLEPDSFFLFGSGHGSDDADMIPATEQVVVWENKEPHLLDDQLIVPGSSVKGAIAHRVAFHFNKAKGITADLLKDKNRAELLNRTMQNGYHLAKMNSFDSCKKEDVIRLITDYNPAVVDLFGYSIQSSDERNISIDNSKTNKKRGRVMISDVFESSKKRKILNHVAIDRFTGGAIDGALFTEQVAAVDKNKMLELNVVVEASANSISLESLEKALKDVVTGLLPLGGGVMRGNGCFTGKLFKNGELIS